MKLKTITPLFLASSTLLMTGCASLCGGGEAESSRFEASRTAGVLPTSFAAAEAECELCAGLGLDISTDAAVIGVGLIADNLLPTGLGAEADIEIGQGSEGHSDDYEVGDFSTLAKTAGFGSDYRIARGSLQARFPVTVGDDSDITVVPLAGLGYYRWKQNDCEDPFDSGFCDAFTSTTVDLGAEVEWKHFGFKLWFPVSGDAPDYALRVRYHVPFGG